MKLFWVLVISAFAFTQALSEDKCVETVCQAPRHAPVARVKHQAPYWEADSVVNGEITRLSLKDFEKKFLIMPKDFTFVCPTELLAFSDRAEDFRRIGAEVVGISVDNEFSHLAWTKKGGLEGIQIPLVSDLTKDISRKYDVLVEEEGVALRGLFIIDREGILRVKHINDFPLGRSVDEALRLVEAIRYADDHGEANWVRGERTMKPDPKSAKLYFESVNK